MTRFTRRAVSGALALSLAVAAGCGGAGSGATPGRGDGPYAAPAKDTTATLTISNWGDPVDKAVYDEVADRFKAKYPNVTIRNNFTPITTWSEYVNKLTTQVAAGDAPDVVNMGLEGVQLGLSKRLFASLDGYLKRDAAAKDLMADVDQRLVAGFQKDGQTYLVPSTWNTMLIYYNTKMFKEAGIARPSDDWTWDDFLAVARKLTKGSGGSKVYGFALPYFNFGLTPWFYSNGASEMSADLSEATLDDPAMVESASWVRDLVTKEGVAPQPKGADPYQLFPAGKVAMTGAGHWTVPMFEQAGFSDYDVLPWPRNKTKATVYGGAGFGLYPGSKNPDLAWEFIKELTNATTQQKWATIGSATPATKKAAALPAFTAKPAHSSLYYGAIEYAKPVAAPVVYNTLEPALMRAMDSIMAGADPKTELAKANDEVKTALGNQ
ncbi:ABC transporter substrate-binding protein [Kribbella sp. NPDC050124]|uniref:ABC transporter substrate-binding protein n=1 Tax=Kribbella sp. NPDC050124 TaxID=3364114 RepID=UPI0037AB28EC